MNSYQEEQIDALRMVRRYLATLSPAELQQLKHEAAEYLDFRREVRSFLNTYFSSICTRTCFHSRLSACCSREGIITFFADVLINAMISNVESLDRLETVLKTENMGYKCIYLGNDGCLWNIKPIVCEMFLCDVAQQEVFGRNPRLQMQWEDFQKRRKGFAWPDKPVLFDDIEDRCIKAGLRSPLMYLNNSPGLLRIKRKWKKALQAESILP